ncbi:hypothetical protein D5S17_09280 [Pseudonocardiaceae bacterium YIM PH 21723]|nr:hypothetical protein D5S17_09280 [Pseudonocardiaceae bacterium YIM PH 21723]
MRPITVTFHVDHTNGTQVTLSKEATHLGEIPDKLWDRIQKAHDALTRYVLDKQGWPLAYVGGRLKPGEALTIRSVEVIHPTSKEDGRADA